MDGLIRTAWRAFWVGLGASAVLLGQTVLSPAPAPATPGDPAVAPIVVPVPNVSEYRSAVRTYPWPRQPS